MGANESKHAKFITEFKDNWLEVFIKSELKVYYFVYICLYYVKNVVVKHMYTS